jgi:anti-sigma factor RsiW
VRCDDLHLTDLVEGTLAAAEQQAADAHLESCPACRALVADFRAIRAAASTLERREPPTALWGHIEARLAAESRGGARHLAWPGTPRGRGTWLAAAASLVAAVGAGLLLLMQSDAGDRGVPAAGPTPASLVDSVQADLQAAESHYEKAIAGLEQIARGETDVLEPQVAAVLQKNLQLVDQAIDESRAALRAQPASATAQDGLFDAMRTKVALLQQTVELINEMRKGNQAEAGRLMQDLSR